MNQFKFDGLNKIWSNRFLVLFLFFLKKKIYTILDFIFFLFLKIICCNNFIMVLTEHSPHL